MDFRKQPYRVERQFGYELPRQQRLLRKGNRQFQLEFKALTTTRGEEYSRAARFSIGLANVEETSKKREARCKMGESMLNRK